MTTIRARINDRLSALEYMKIPVNEETILVNKKVAWLINPKTYLKYLRAYSFFSTIKAYFFIDEKSSTNIENKGELLLGKKEINRYHLIAFFIWKSKLQI